MNMGDSVTRWHNTDCGCSMSVTHGWVDDKYWQVKTITLQPSVFCSGDHQEVDFELTRGYLQAGAKGPAGQRLWVPGTETEENPNEVSPS